MCTHDIEDRDRQEESSRKSVYHNMRKPTGNGSVRFGSNRTIADCYFILGFINIMIHKERDDLFPSLIKVLLEG